MAGDWIKLRSNLWDDPRISRLCDLCDCGEAQVIGALYWLWATADQHTEDGVLPGMSLRQIDRKTGVQGFGQALCDIGWLADHPEGVRLVRFEEHNGASAKRRCMEAQRKATGRKLSASDADTERTEGGQEPPNPGQVAELEKEKRRDKEDTSPESAGSSSARPTLPCPYAEIVALYHEHLPELPRVRLMAEERKAAIRKRWAWVLSEPKSDGKPRATNADEALQWFAGYFARSRDNDFLMGRTPRDEQHKDWRPDLDFLLTSRGLKHVIEKTREAA